jgi:steroid 5-alpha reductase family enzyme
VDSLRRKLLLPVLLCMWGAMYWMWSNGLLVPPLVVSIIMAHVICLIIYYHFVYVFNYGYSMIMIALPTMFGFAYDLSFPALIVTAISVLFGLRLGSFTWMRYHSSSFAERAEKAAAATQLIPLPVKIITWLFTSSLMFCLAFNVWVVAASNTVSIMIWPAIILMVVGLALEAVADNQKQRAKQTEKNEFCYEGLYRKIRHPNYLGEMIFHIGLYAAMASATDENYPFIVGAFGTGWVLMLMTREAQSNDRRQQERYGNTERFAEYRRNTGLLWPPLG